LEGIGMIDKATENKIQKFGEHLKNSETRAAKAEGEKDGLLKRLKEEYGLSEKDIESRLPKIKTEKDRVEERIKVIIKEIEETYEIPEG
jgi:hypothetical protein